MRFDFLEWYKFAYCLEDFETISDYEDHKKIAYAGWLAAMKVYDIKPLN